jgi:hypothetical protein
MGQTPEGAVRFCEARYMFKFCQPSYGASSYGPVGPCTADSAAESAPWAEAVNARRLTGGTSARLMPFYFSRPVSSEQRGFFSRNSVSQQRVLLWVAAPSS